MRDYGLTKAPGARAERGEDPLDPRVHLGADPEIEVRGRAVLHRPHRLKPEAVAAACPTERHDDGGQRCGRQCAGPRASAESELAAGDAQLSIPPLLEPLVGGAS